jgi:hypothetical protein
VGWNAHFVGVKTFAKIDRRQSMEHGLSKVVGVVMFHGVLGAQGL